MYPISITAHYNPNLYIPSLLPLGDRCNMALQKRPYCVREHIGSNNKRRILKLYLNMLKWAMDVYLCLCIRVFVLKAVIIC